MSYYFSDGSALYEEDLLSIIKEVIPLEVFRYDLLPRKHARGYRVDVPRYSNNATPLWINFEIIHFEKDNKKEIYLTGINIVIGYASDIFDGVYIDMMDHTLDNVGQMKLFFLELKNYLYDLRAPNLNIKAIERRAGEIWFNVRKSGISSVCEDAIASGDMLIIL